MKKIITLLIIIYSLFTVHCFAQWFQLNSGISYEDALWSVNFPDSNTGYCVGYNATVLKTTDAGAHWLKLNAHVQHRCSLFSVFFTNINTGYIVGGIDSIIQTTDGGNSWFYHKLPYSGNIWYSVYFVNSNTGFICGGFTENAILKTTDAGVNWSIIYNNNYSEVYESICFPDTSTGYVVGENVILHTTDGGNDWFRQKFTVPLFGLYSTDINTCYAVGGAGYIMKTADRGNNWDTLFKDTTISWLSSVYFTNANTGYTVSYDGSIYKTTNAGTNWLKQYSDLNEGFGSVFFTDFNTGYVVGGNYILKTTNGGGTWINEVQGSKFKVQSYPNPITDILNIDVENIVSNNPVILQIYNLQGEEIINQQILNEHERLNVSYLQEGMYILKINNHNTLIAKKLIKTNNL